MPTDAEIAGDARRIGAQKEVAAALGLTLAQFQQGKALLAFLSQIERDHNAR